MKIEAYEVGAFAVNTYLVVDEQANLAAIVDPSFDSEGILSHIERRGLKVEYIINTHGHVDHVVADGFLKERTGAPLLIHEADLPLLRNMVQQAVTFGVKATAAPEPDRLIADGDTITFGSITLTVLHTPGHSPGSVCLLGGTDVIVGDTLFAGSIGRTDFPGGSHEQLIHSVRTKLFVLPDETKVYPGHMNATTIGTEKKFNPFFQDGSSRLWVP